ncbi:hypothetical protein [Mycobacterium sp. URHB0044]|uniref:hypothetical protein n=1 Tax=Mycobacterium sp. URHB0044 TaxID=1380386 RepID=UPI0012DF4E20|nr:hypothetical protein [Mycobacterium sp. URHB0044]
MHPDSGVVALTPVVLLGVDGPDIPKRPASGDAAAWTRWRQRFWAAIGVAAVDVPDGMHIAVRAIQSDRLLDAVIDYAVECAHESGGFAPYTDGGVVVQYRDEVIVSPDCSDLEEGLDDWLAVLRGRPEVWATVHNGHRVGMARVVNDVIELRLEQPVDGDAILGPFVTVQLPRDPVAAAAEVAINERNEFSRRLESRLRQRGWRDARTVAATIAGTQG